MTTYQLTLEGKPEIAGDAVDKIRYLLETYDDARNDYMALIGRYWLEFDGLDWLFFGASDDSFNAAFLEWMTTKATSPKTIQNRAMELQSWHRSLDADGEVRARRQKQAKQGPVR